MEDPAPRFCSPRDRAQSVRFPVHPKNLGEHLRDRFNECLGVHEYPLGMGRLGRLTPVYRLGKSLLCFWFAVLALQSCQGIRGRRKCTGKIFPALPHKVEWLNEYQQSPAPRNPRGFLVLHFVLQS